MNQQTAHRNKCPKCKKEGLDTRIPRPALMKLFLSWLPLRRYICYQCNRKSYKWRKAPAAL